jgi:hypothetical protein
MDKIKPDIIAPEHPKEQDVVAILMTVGDAHKLAVADPEVGMLVRSAITARLVGPASHRHTRAVLEHQRTSGRWARLYAAMADDLNPEAVSG